ncbi:MAG: hypothetical protein ACI4CS_00235 [Candidatus Weimeria sp.]
MSICDNSTYILYDQQSVNAEAAVTSELLKKELDGSCEIVDGLKELGLTSEQAKNILSLDRHDSTYYNDIQSEIDSLKKPSNDMEVATLIRRDIQKKSAQQKTKSASSLPNGNPPTDEEEQSERILHVYQDASDRFSDVQTISDYMVYFYLSHYVDNPYYSKESPNFDQIYAHDLTSTDIKTYDTFISETHFIDWCTLFKSILSELSTVKGTSEDIKERFESSKNIIINTVKVIKDEADLANNAKGALNEGMI